MHLIEKNNSTGFTCVLTAHDELSLLPITVR